MCITSGEIVEQHEMLVYDGQDGASVFLSWMFVFVDHSHLSSLSFPSNRLPAIYFYGLADPSPPLLRLLLVIFFLFPSPSLPKTE